MTSHFVVASSAKTTPDGDVDIMDMHVALASEFPSNVSLAYDWSKSAAAYKSGFPDIKALAAEWKHSVGDARAEVTRKLARVLVGDGGEQPSTYWAAYTKGVEGAVRASICRSRHVVMCCVGNGPVTSVERLKMEDIKEAIERNLKHLSIMNVSKRLTIEMFDTHVEFEDRVRAAVQEENLQRDVENQLREHPMTIPREYIDFITQHVMEDPVKVQVKSETFDTWERYGNKSIKDWIAKCRSSNAPITSPKSGFLLVDGSIERDLEFEGKLKMYMSQFRHDIVDLPHESKRLNASMQQLEDLVAMLDSVQPRVAQVIDGWTPPHVVVLGLESSGKSTLLERLLKLPVFPRAPNVCTRMPIRVQVRRGGSQVGIVLSIVERETKTKIEGPIMLRQDDSEERIRDTMNKMVCGTDNGYVTDKELEIVVTSPVLPPINMIDLPGLVAAPADAATATNALAREYIRRYKENSVFLLVGQASLEPHLSVAYALVHPQGIEDRCIGVLTKMDEIHQMDPRLIDILKGSAEPPKAQLKPHGFIGTANPYTELQANESPMVRLYHGERREVEQLEAMGLRGHGVVEILSRVRVLYKEKMLNDMVPNVVACLLSNRADVKRKHAELGLPVANGILDTDQVLDDDQLQRLSEKIGERLLTLTGVYEEQAQAIQTKEKERLQQTLWEHMLKQHQGFNTAGFSQCPCRSSVSRQKSHSLSQCRVDLLKMCQKSVKNLSADLQANLDEVFCDDATPLRLQRFPSIVSEMKRELSIQLTVSDSLYDVVFSVFRLSQELGGDGSEFPLCIYSDEGLQKIAKRMAQLTHSSQLTASPSSTIDISKIVRTELLKETCHATRSDLQKEFAQITNAVGSMIEVSQIRVDRLLPLVRDAHEKEALLKRQLEIKRADHLENWTDYFTLVLPHDVEDQDLQFFEVAKAKGAGHQKQRHDAPQRTPRTSPQPCYRRLRCCCIVMLLFQILMWLLLMWSLGLIDIGCSLVSAPVMWAAVSGECTQNGTCVASPNFPGKYGHMQKCVLGINLASVVPIRVEHFRTEQRYDKLVVNGVEYSGTASPDGVIPTASITWTSDGDHSNQGWRLCEAPVEPVDAALELARERVTAAEVLRQPMQFCCDHFDIGCSLVSAPVMWAAVSGECTQNGTCVASPNFPGKYGHMQKCVLGINLASVVPIRVEHFRTEHGYDKLVVNGVEYSGTASPDGVIPTASITWTSDGDHSHQGWRLCEASSPA